MTVEERAERVSATKARASLGEILARTRYGGCRFVSQQHGDPAVVVMGYEDYQRLMALLDDLEDIRDLLESEGEPTRPLREYLAERGQSDA